MISSYPMEKSWIMWKYVFFWTFPTSHLCCYPALYWIEVSTLLWSPHLPLLDCDEVLLLLLGSEALRTSPHAELSPDTLPGLQGVLPSASSSSRSPCTRAACGLVLRPRAMVCAPVPSLKFSFTPGLPHLGVLEDISSLNSVILSTSI